jgi:hypothetical protein
MSQRIQLLAKSALALFSNVRLNGLVRWKDYNVFASVFQSTAEALWLVKKLANFFMTMSHFVSLFVPIMSQPPAPGFSALTGYGGRCTARTVPKETKKNSPIIIATNVSFMTAGGKLMFSLSHPLSTEALERSSRKTLNGDSIEPVLKQLSWKAKDENRRNLDSCVCFGVLGNCRRTTHQGNPSYSRGRGAAGAIFPAWRFTIDLDWAFLPVSPVMRLLVEILIVAALIYLGWNRPFKEWAA